MLIATNGSGSGGDDQPEAAASASAGLAMNTSDGSFRIALKPFITDTGDGASSEDVRTATATRSGDSVGLAWDEGGKDSPARVGS
ncbi:hypothetical protein [Streptomyces sp. NBC_01235]|uniref:hypothetical protein n=1 Tax=Streptomyces sp. NBC_01235 TaxID=2903788 RepID=UPI002E0E7849|nr:hypothetical protein OG289_20195 [Streptomyces sp. NBC_01235]